MPGLTGLWLPILLSAVVVFIASSIIHMVFTGWHRSDYPRIPNEDQVRSALRPLNIPPGDYMVPRAGSTEEMRSPEFQEKFKQGPSFMMTMLPTGGFTMGKSLAQWFIYCLVVGLFAAYVASRTLPAGADYLTVFRVTGTVAFASYALALWQATIWYHRSVTTTVKSTIDGLLYALLTGGVFGALWPSAVV